MHVASAFVGIVFDGDEDAKASSTLREVGNSLVGGATTTASSAVFLLGGYVIVLFTQFGQFIVLSVTVCLVVSFVMLVPALASFRWKTAHSVCI